MPFIQDQGPRVTRTDGSMNPRTPTIASRWEPGRPTTWEMVGKRAGISISALREPDEATKTAIIAEYNRIHAAPIA